MKRTKLFEPWYGKKPSDGDQYVGPIFSGFCACWFYHADDGKWHIPDGMSGGWSLQNGFDGQPCDVCFLPIHVLGEHSKYNHDTVLFRRELYLLHLCRKRGDNPISALPKDLYELLRRYVIKGHRGW